MPKVNFGITYKGIDAAQNIDGYSVDLINGYRLVLGEEEQFIKNTGVKELFTGLAGFPQGIYESIGGTVLCIANGIVHELYSSGTSIQYGGETLNTSNPCVFTEDGTYIFAANGGYIAKINTTTKAVSFLSSGPNYVTHVSYKKGYLIANGLISGGVVGDVNYSDDSAGGYASWEVYNNEQSPDGCTAIVVGWDAELYAFGPNSVELSINGTDPDNPWEALPGAVMEYGTPAPYSIVLVDNTLFWLTIANQRRSIVKMVNRAPIVISSQYDTVINDMGNVSDARAWVHAENDHAFYVISFPSEGKTFQYNLRTGEWSERASWNITTATWGRYIGSFGMYIKTWNKFLVADYGYSTIHELYGTNDNGNLIKFQLSSGNNSFSTHFKKKNVFDVIRFSGGNSSEFSISYRDDFKSWSNPRIISMGEIGEYDSFRRLFKVGVFRSRQYRIIHTDDSDFTFLGMEANFSVLLK